MADVKHLIGQGIGFSPGSVAFIVRDGLGAQAAPVIVTPFILGRHAPGVPASGRAAAATTVSGRFAPSTVIKGQANG